MNKRKLEALAEAVASVSGYHVPGSVLHTARNPGGLRACRLFKCGQYIWQPRDQHGNRKFRSITDGLQALIFDTQLKLQGMSRHCLQPSSTLQDFAVSHGQPPTAGDAYAKFLRKALSDETINKKTELMYFLEDSDGR